MCALSSGPRATDRARARAACAARGATSRCSSSPTPSGPNRSTTCSSATTCPTGPSWARAPDRRTVSRRTRANARGAPSTLGARSCRMTIGSEPRGETTRRIDGRRSGGARPNHTPPRARGRRIVVLPGTAVCAADGRAPCLMAAAGTYDRALSRMAGGRTPGRRQCPHCCAGRARRACDAITTHSSDSVQTQLHGPMHATPTARAPVRSPSARRNA